jgi:flagellar motility protein MotE (MotC chaperone)
MALTSTRTGINRARRRTANAEGPRAKLRRGRFILIAAVVLLVTLIFVFCLLAARANIFGTRDWFVGAVARLDPEYAALNDRELALDEREQTLDERAEQLASDQKKQDTRDEALNLREDEMDEREANARAAFFRPPLTEQELEDLRSLGRVYAKMDAGVAADILMRLYEIEYTAAILYHMPEKYAAAVLAAMDAERAARITEILLEE